MATGNVVYTDIPVVFITSPLGFSSRKTILFSKKNKKPTSKPRIYKDSSCDDDLKQLFTRSPYFRPVGLFVVNDGTDLGEDLADSFVDEVCKLDFRFRPGQYLLDTMLMVVIQLSLDITKDFTATELLVDHAFPFIMKLMETLPCAKVVFTGSDAKQLLLNNLEFMRAPCLDVLPLQPPKTTTKSYGLDGNDPSPWVTCLDYLVFLTKFGHSELKKIREERGFTHAVPEGCLFLETPIVSDFVGGKLPSGIIHYDYQGILDYEPVIKTKRRLFEIVSHIVKKVLDDNIKLFVRERGGASSGGCTGDGLRLGASPLPGGKRFDLSIGIPKRGASDGDEVKRNNAHRFLGSVLLEDHETKDAGSAGVNAGSWFKRKPGFGTDLTAKKNNGKNAAEKKRGKAFPSPGPALATKDRRAPAKAKSGDDFTDWGFWRAPDDPVRQTVAAARRGRIQESPPRTTGPPTRFSRRETKTGNASDQPVQNASVNDALGVNDGGKVLALNKGVKKEGEDRGGSVMAAGENGAGMAGHAEVLLDYTQENETPAGALPAPPELDPFMPLPIFKALRINKGNGDGEGM